MMYRSQNIMEIIFTMHENRSLEFTSPKFCKNQTKIILSWVWCCVSFSSLVRKNNWLNATILSVVSLLISNPSGDSKWNSIEWLVQKLHDIWLYSRIWHFGLCCSRWLIMKQYPILFWDHSLSTEVQFYFR